MIDISSSYILGACLKQNSGKNQSFIIILSCTLEVIHGFGSPLYVNGYSDLKSI